LISSNQINNCRLYKQPLSLINMCLKSPLFPIRTKVNSLEMSRIWSHTRENDLFTLEKGAFSCVSCYIFLNCKLVEMFHIAYENNTGIYFQMFVSFAYLIVNGFLGNYNFIFSSDTTWRGIRSKVLRPIHFWRGRSDGRITHEAIKADRKREGVRKRNFTWGH